MNSVAEILLLIQQLILTGGNRTMASGLRTILNAITNSYANYKDGGLNFQNIVGYASNSIFTTSTDPRAFAYKGYVDSQLQVALRKYPTYADFLAATEVVGIGDFEAWISVDETASGQLMKYGFINGTIKFIVTEPNT